MAADGIGDSAWQLEEVKVAGGVVCVIAVDVLVSSDSTSIFVRENKVSSLLRAVEYRLVNVATILRGFVS